MKVGDKIIVYFACAGVVSEEERTITALTESEIVTSEEGRDDTGNFGNRRFSAKTGKCLNDYTAFGARRFVKPA